MLLDKNARNEFHDQYNKTTTERRTLQFAHKFSMSGVACGKLQAQEQQLVLSLQTPLARLGLTRVCHFQ